jgi:creatinine amidohydrolase/Fe(II)-dependent formamide hydrolase-like protein
LNITFFFEVGNTYWVSIIIVTMVKTKSTQTIVRVFRNIRKMCMRSFYLINLHLSELKKLRY